ncbi:MAG: HAD hydrolase-like protein [Nostoc sp.]|uniref:HAD hydrolase-like protein n=1 Tax=Nostoc sp. TaxID=1180 RepID=UPI002FF4AF22
MKILLLDLNGTIRCGKTGKYIEWPQGQKPMLGADKAIEHFAARNWQIIGISNQAAIAAGYKILEATIVEMQFTLQLFPQLQEIFFCPDFEGRKCIMVSREKTIKCSLDSEEGYELVGNLKEINFRKPEDGMLRAAIEKYSRINIESFLESCKVDPEYDCWMIGDRKEDKKAAASLGINYLDAEIWRRQFVLRMHEVRQITPTQVRFMEGIEIDGYTNSV